MQSPSPPKRPIFLARPGGSFRRGRNRDHFLVLIGQNYIRGPKELPLCDGDLAFPIGEVSSLSLDIEINAASCSRERHPLFIRVDPVYQLGIPALPPLCLNRDNQVVA